jgi:hypothetical protein
MEAIGTVLLSISTQAVKTGGAHPFPVAFTMVPCLRSSFKSSNDGSIKIELKSPFSPFFKRGFFSVGSQPLFGKEGEGRFSDGMTRELCSELLIQVRIAFAVEDICGNRLHY